MVHASQKFYAVWFRRFLLVVAGLVLAAGFWNGLFKTFAQYRLVNEPIKVLPVDKNKYIILAIGESTTAPLTGPAWPEFLEKILNDRVGYEKFQVINAGISGTNTSEIAKNIPRYISRYHPNIVISMMGINDLSYLDFPELSLPWYQQVMTHITQSPLYRFISILGRQVIGRSQRELLQKASHCTDTSMGEKALRVLDERGDTVTESQKIAFINTYPFSFYGYRTLIDYYASKNQWNDVSEWVRRAYVMEPFIRYCATLTSGNNPMHTKELIRQIDTTFSYVSSMNVVSRTAIAHPNMMSATWYQKARAMLFVPPIERMVDTKKNYQKVSAFVLACGIDHIAMQYPLYPVWDLKELMGNDPRVTFVSNEENFQNALKEHSYDELFIDHFTGVFGHTTELGSHIIADAVANTILDTVLLQ